MRMETRSSYTLHNCPYHSALYPDQYELLNVNFPLFKKKTKDEDLLYTNIDSLL